MDTLKQCKVSVIITVFGVKIEYLEKCIESIRNQTLNELEIVIVDDGSEEKIALYLDTLATLDKRIHVIHQINQGVSAARNKGMEIASGEYLTFLDCDDWLDDNCCEIAYEAAKLEKAQMVAFSHIKEYQNKKKESKVYQKTYLVYKDKLREKYRQLDGVGKYWFNPFDMRIMGYSTMKLYRKELIDYQKFDTTLKNGEDVEFLFRIYRKLETAVYLNQTFYHYRQLPDSAVRGFHNDTVTRYEHTLKKINCNLIDCEKKEFYDAYIDFVAISYLMVCLNYIFHRENHLNFSQKLKLVKEISTSMLYKEAIKNTGKMRIPLSRKSALIFAKYKIYIGVYIVMKCKNILSK